jgi:hypothetical protein
MRQLKISKSITNRESASLEKYLRQSLKCFAVTLFDLLSQFHLLICCEKILVPNFLKVFFK